MKTIWKENLLIRDYQTIQMPENAVILSVADQNGNLCLWFMADQKKPLEDRNIEIFGTGHPIHEDMGVERKFIGTVVTYKTNHHDPGLVSSLVWHVFERIS
jgi:hypothetical protein